MDRANAAGPAVVGGDARPAGSAVIARPAGGGPAVPSAAKCRIREILGRIGDKWSLFIIFQLGDGPQRFTTLKRAVDGISQRMLTVTLRGLERDGIVSRTMYPVMPPRVDYALTPLGHTLLDAVGALMAWVDEHLPEVDAARDAYDARAAGGAPELPAPAPHGRPGGFPGDPQGAGARQPGPTSPA
jgi:DNA-binding HxlR family transcriptional regulator